jgi:hypothetical protein
VTERTPGRREGVCIGIEEVMVWFMVFINFSFNGSVIRAFR